MSKKKPTTMGDFRAATKEIPDDYSIAFAQSAVWIDERGVDVNVSHESKHVYFQG